MKKFEHLFSQDPIGAFEKIEEDYKRYFKAAYKISNEKLDEERMEALGDNLSKEPYLEVLPEYAPATGLSTMDDLINRFSNFFGEREYAKEFFEDFISKGLMQGLMDQYIPYGHQIGMLEKAFAGIDEKGKTLKYKNTVITSGTGSGKTESFLLPLLADIYKEYINNNWGQAASHINWYEGVVEEQANIRRYTPNQRSSDPRRAAIRALVLYPMNALVEDQMARLREALDCDDVRKFMQEKMNGNRIYFGRYNGATIAPKSYDLLNDSDHQNTFNRKRQEVAEQLKEIHDNFEFVNNYVNNHPDKKDALYIEPRLGGDLTTSEMITRWDMQYWAPDIMITNTSMLSIMLMRRAESKMFEDTRRWLAAEDLENLPEEQREKAKKNRVFHIIVDELHLYRGTAGSEVACLLRMLYNAIGLEPVIDDGHGNKIPNPQIKILASSASLGDEMATQKFMEEFFGIYSTIPGETVFNVQAGSNYTGSDQNITIDYTLFSEFNHENFIAIELETNNAGNVKDIRTNKVQQFIKEKFDCDSIVEFCEKYEEQIFNDFFNCLPSNTDGSKRPIAQSELVKSLFKGNKEAYRGFLIFRGYIDTLYRNHKLPRFRFHKFFKYIEGLWGELNPSLSDEVPPVKNLSYNAKEVGARKVLELLRCENCGQLFIGGNRKKEDDGSISLTLNFPNLEQIPNFNPTPMVQNKNYLEYAIFWPKDLNTQINLTRKGRSEEGANDHVVEISSGNHTANLGKAQWVPGYLDSLTGKFIPKDRSISSNTEELDLPIQKNGIQGFLYQVVDNNDQEIDSTRASRIYAAPCTCPHCLQDYTLRKYTNSPIRSFRTGIDRSNQILSKELLYQLDDKSAKLIGFSDSREDAAKQALGIEKEQYRDMVRMLFVECVNEVGIDDIVDFIKQELLSGTKKKDIRAKVKEKWLRQDISDVTNAIFDAIDDDDYSNLLMYSQNNILLSNLISSNNYGFDGTLVRKLLQRGINPAGEAYKFQWYKRDNAPGLYHWSTAYDFNTFSLVRNPHFLDNTYPQQIRNQLENAVFANSFGKYMGVSVLDAGIGYISGPQSADIETSQEYQALRNLLPANINVYEFVDAFIRVMGDNYLYPSVEGRKFYEKFYDNYANLKDSVKRPIKKFCTENNIDKAQLGNALVAYLKKYCTDENVLSLELERLSFTKMTKDRYLKCPNCGRVHPNMGFGFCTNTCCMKTLDPNRTVDTDSLHNHYISFDILKEKKAPRRLHTEELSGQTDDIQARLREFKDLILIKDDDPTKRGKEMTMPIDMLCVTTTMEVGVDIGSLQAILQGNMPPTRYNYQQRVGRGGRRGQAYSTAFTFCRGRSHDVYYYEKATDEMVGGIPATPTLSLAPYRDTDGQMRMKKAIMKRVVVKEILHQAFIGLDYQYDLQDTAGEFGRISEWNNVNKETLQNWLTNNEVTVNVIVHRYFDQFNTNGQIQNDIQDIINWISNDMISQIDNAVHKATNPDMGLASYLSEAGFLPMYGMPSDVRNFYHGYDSVFNRVKSIDRSSEIAITEFAPGSEKTKDKGKYRVEGLTIPIMEEANNGRINFYNPNGDALSDRYILSYIKNIGENDNNIIEITEAPHDTPSDQINLADNQRLIVIPQAYRSLDIVGNTGTPVENNDKGSSFTQSQIFARDNSSIQTGSNKKTVYNVDISMYEMGLNEDPTVWHVNSNNNRFYTGTYASLPGQPNGNTANFMFYDNKNGQEEIVRKGQGQNTIDIALGSKKVTEMIKLELRSYPAVLDLSLKTGNKSAIRAAFYSAAFLLQRALADKLDVQPDEIEICEKIDGNFAYPTLYLSDALPNGAGIVSYLYQDGKLEELIRCIIDFDSFDVTKTPKDKSFMQSLISQEHRCNCLTACQKCLLTYNNRGFHHVLDWRLGVGILRLMLDENYDFGFDINTRANYEELQDWNHIVHECAKKFNLEAQREEQYYWINRNGICSIFYHPLWNRTKVIEMINEKYTGLKMFNTFNILRSDLTEDKDDRLAAHIQQPGASWLNRIRGNKQPISPTITSQLTPIDVDDDIVLQ